MKNVIFPKRIVLLFTIIISFCCAIAASANTGLTKIADGVFSYVNEKNPSPGTSFGANAGIIVGKDGIVVIDTLISAKEAQRFIRDIRAVSDKPIRYVVNTHDHLDHVLGNSEFVKLGATIIAQTDTKAAMVKNGDALLQRAKYFGLSDGAMSGTTVVAPSLTFSDAMEIDLGDKKIDLLHAGPSHTAGSSIVFISTEFGVGLFGSLGVEGGGAFSPNGGGGYGGGTFGAGGKATVCYHWLVSNTETGCCKL
jgi:cyclase